VTATLRSLLRQAWSRPASIRPRAFTRAELLAGLQAALVPFAVSRVLVWVGTEFGARYFPRTAPYHAGGFKPSDMLAPFFHWDFDYYVSIARYGYVAVAADVHPPSYRVAFFPLYPFLVRIAGGSDWSMLIISNLSLLAAMALLYVIATRYIGADRAALALWVLALGPAAMFFSYPYTESLFLLLCVGAFALTESGAWLLAGLVGLAAATTRVPGVLVAAAFGAEFVLGNRRWTIVLAGLLTVVGLGVVIWLDWAQMGDPLGWVHAQQYWVVAYRNPLYLVGSWPNAALHGDPFGPEAIGVPVLIGFAIAAGWAWLRMPLAYSLFAVALLLVDTRQALYLHTFISMPRYVAVVFPCYLAFAALLAPRRKLQLTWLVTSASVMVLHSALYGAFRFAG
jgi:Dolichyl-phosphate-mannose-protein mannosyltransferase